MLSAEHTGVLVIGNVMQQLITKRALRASGCTSEGVTMTQAVFVPYLLIPLFWHNILVPFSGLGLIWHKLLDHAGVCIRAIQNA